MKNTLLFLIFLPLSCLAQKETNYRNLVFEGGGIRGLAYAGVIKALDEKGVLDHIERTAGSSVGAVSALLISLGYSTNEIDSVLSNLPLQSFNDGKWIFFGGISRMKKNYGWYQGNEFEKWIRNIIAGKTGNPDISFEGLHELSLTNKKYKDFYCTGTNLSLQKAEVFGYTSTPGMKISTAVRISVSIPLYFGAVFLNDKGEAVKPGRKKDYTVYVDGGLLTNYPLTIFDSCGAAPSIPFYCDSLVPNFSTLGVKLERPEQILYNDSGYYHLAGYKINNINSYVSALYNVLFETVNRQNKTADEKSRTIYVSTSDISPRIRSIKEEEKNTLIQNGYKGVQNYFENH